MINSPRSPFAYRPPIFRSFEKLEASTLPVVRRAEILKAEGKASLDVEPLNRLL